MKDDHKSESPLSVKPERTAMQKAIKDLLTSAGFDPTHPHLQDTPQRVASCWLEDLLDGYSMSPAAILSDAFPSQNEGLVVVRNIHVHGLCPHHLLPFSGVAHIAYQPQSKVVGFSRLAELTRCFTHRLTLQETATRQIANALLEHLDARGAGCILEAVHTCMTLRGKDQRESRVLTSSFLGSLQTNPPWPQMMPHHP